MAKRWCRKCRQYIENTEETERVILEMGCGPSTADERRNVAPPAAACKHSFISESERVAERNEMRGRIITDFGYGPVAQEHQVHRQQPTFRQVPASVGSLNSQPAARPVNHHLSSTFAPLRNVNELCVTVPSTIALNKTYKIEDAQHKFIYKGEDNVEYCCSAPPINVEISDAQNNALMHFHRPANCGITCLEDMQIFAPLNSRIGYISQNFDIWGCRKYNIVNQDRQLLYHIQCPIITGSILGGPKEFPIFANRDVKVGSIIRILDPAWHFFKDDRYRITFDAVPSDTGRILILAACILISKVHYDSAYNY